MRFLFRVSLITLAGRVGRCSRHIDIRRGVYRSSIELSKQYRERSPASQVI